AGDHPFGRRELAEALWGIAHRNILEFLADVPADRRRTVHFEELLRAPEATLREICDFLGLEYDPAMAEPYQKSSGRMTDGLYAESRMLGDVKFHEHGAVRAGVAERWRQAYTRDFLAGSTWSLASRLGYDVEKERVGVRPPSCLSMLRPGTSGQPLFLVHPLSGELLLYRHLVGGLSADQAVYGFQAQGFLDGEQPLERIEDMADLYVEALLSFQPEGPYLLAGSSMGGLIAFEMARRLRALGREVALTVLIDAPTPGRVKDQDGDGEGEAELDVLRYATGGRTPVDLEELRVLQPDQRLELVLEKGREAGGFAGMDLAGLRRLVRILEANRRAMRAYQPDPAEVQVTYIRASEGVRADAAWKPLALGGLEVSEVAGNHLGMHFPPHVGALAERLAASIERAATVGPE
ncbi:MAG TPA: thioesterase domain-containing protein, partial [Thermoanaerobaculia bacterium]|nr:thioesterase domain-containing protein [Thermoanaerobaculia bacterium]